MPASSQPANGKTLRALGAEEGRFLWPAAGRLLDRRCLRILSFRWGCLCLLGLLVLLRLRLLCLPLACRGHVRLHRLLVRRHLGFVLLLEGLLVLLAQLLPLLRGELSDGRDGLPLTLLRERRPVLGQELPVGAPGGLLGRIGVLLRLLIAVITLALHVLLL